jgi:Fe2+ transport system protein FeoA
VDGRGAHRLAPAGPGQKGDDMDLTRCVRLDQLGPGAGGIVRRLTGGGGFRSRLAALGVTQGVRIEVLQNGRHGPLLVLARDTRLAIGRGEAQKILVEALPDERPDSR